MPRPAVDVPSRVALDEAERHNRSSGNGLLGYLSEALGFMPPKAPSTTLPTTHAPWDELALDLPAHFRAVTFREAARHLPRLDASPHSLSDQHVRRAATVLGILSHTWFRVDTEPPDGPLPESLARPWAQVCDRLHRPTAFLEFEDITTANWRFVDPAAPDPTRVENLDLLVPSVGNDAERFFMMTLVELSARATPIIGAVVRAQEAIARDDRDGLESELVVLVHTVRGLADALAKADPNPYGPTYVDPVVWGVTVAPFAVSINPEAPSPGGTAAPLFQVLDAFLGRRAYESLLGKEVRRLQNVAPPLHRAFVDAVAEMPLGAFLARAGTPTLRGLARALMEVYAGGQGLLQAHRIKAYGYLEVAFKVGRPITLSGFEGVFRERPWKQVDDALEASMRERNTDGIDAWVSRATLARRDIATPSVKRIDLDVSQQGVVYAPGDRIAVIPDNAPALIARTIEALDVPRHTDVKLTAAWRAALELRGEDPTVTTLPLDLFLRWAKVRPLLRPVAKALYALSAAPELGEVIEGRYEDQLELWDALSMMTAAGYDVRRLTDAMPWEPENLAAIVPPESERLYSISSAPASPVCQLGLVLTVGDVTYHTADLPGRASVDRHGTASHWLNHHMDGADDALPLRVVRAAGFQLCDDPTRPVVMFAGGTGISPFRGFLEARAAGDRASGDNVLFYAARRAVDLSYRDELDAWVRQSRLELYVSLSQDATQLEALPGTGLVEVDGTPGHVQDLVAAQADRLWELVGPGTRGVIYVCGKAGFAHAVMDALRAVAAARIDVPDGGADHVRRLVGEDRLRLDVFTETTSLRAPGPLGARTVPASELITRNDDGAGYWLAIDGAVYDVTEFRRLHPGGVQIIDESAGTDATAEYEAVLHHLNGEVRSMLSMYKIGILRRLRLGSSWGIAVTGTRFADVSVVDLYRAWVRYAYLVVEMQNALRNDWLYRHLALTRGEADDLTTQKLMLLANTHDRFVVQYLDGTLGEELVELWRLTTGLCGTSVPMNELPRAVDAVRAGAGADGAAEVATRLRRLYTVSRAPEVVADGQFWTDAASLWDGVRVVQETYLAALKGVVREGLLRFESHEHDVVNRAGAELIELLRSVPSIVNDEHTSIAGVWHDSGMARWLS